MQTNVILALASNDENPITSAITAAINTSTGNTNITDNTNNSNIPNNNYARSNHSNSGSTVQATYTPITPPITQPTPTPDPITSPITNPDPTPTSIPTPAPDQPSQPSNNPSSQPGNPQAPVCGDSKPTSAPKIVSAISNQPNQVVLVWSKANDPVSYYLIAYGAKPGKPEFGNPNIGDKNAIIYTVKGLSGNATYYFKVRAGNGCMPGEFSNEVGVKVVGPKTNSKIAEGFKAGVLSAKTKQSTQQAELKYQPITSAQPQRVVVESAGFLTRILKFAGNLFNRK